MSAAPNPPARTIEIAAPAPPSDWDAFVEGHPLGQFQQSSAWAQTKALDGWSSTWAIVREGGRIVAGTQVLTKATRAGRIGFLNKGPLASDDQGEYRADISRAIVDLQARQGLTAIIAQAPDRDQHTADALRAVGFAEDALLPIISATQVIDISRPWATVEQEFRRSTRKKIRQARDRGVAITDGGADDIPHFFELMKSTCERQRTSPNPPSVEAAAALWRAFSTAGHIRLHFAVHEGRRIAAGLCLLFGDRATFWKKGWDQSNSLLQANTILTCDAIQWAAEHGYRWLDFAAVSRDVAEAMIGNTELPADVEERRDYFNLGFGGESWLLAPVMVRFRRPAAQAIYRLAQTPLLRPWAQRALKGLAV